MNNPLLYEDLVRERVQRHEVEMAELESFRQIISRRQTLVNLSDFISGLICWIGSWRLRVSGLKEGLKISDPC